jgi:3-hydroxyisobutyrate dehydrogenase
MAIVAVLGTGIMGAPIAYRLADAGHEVRAWNRTLEKVQPLVDSGVGVADAWEPAEGAAQANAIVTMLSDADAIEQVVVGEFVLEAMAPGTLWLQMSTIGPSATARFAGHARERGILFVDAPVLGSKSHAENGQLFVLASGPDEARAPADELFAPLARRVEWLGGAGVGSALKLAFNNWILCTLENLAETLTLTGALGVEPGRFLELLEGEPFDMAYAHVKGALMLEREYPPAFPLRHARKDLRLVLAEADGKAALPLVETVRAQFDRAVELGHGDEDASAVARALESA